MNSVNIKGTIGVLGYFCVCVQPWKWRKAEGGVMPNVSVQIIYCSNFYCDLISGEKRKSISDYERGSKTKGD